MARQDLDSHGRPRAGRKARADTRGGDLRRAVRLVPRRKRAGCHHWRQDAGSAVGPRLVERRCRSCPHLHARGYDSILDAVPRSWEHVRRRRTAPRGVHQLKTTPRLSFQGSRLSPGQATPRQRVLQTIAGTASQGANVSFANRRSFITILSSVAGSLALRPSRIAAQSAAPSGAFDMTWLDQMRGQHKQLYDLGGQDLAEDSALRFANNFLNTFRDAFHLEFPNINTAVGVSGRAFAMNASDRLWAKYALGERSKIIDRATMKPAVRNIFLDGELGVRALQARGTVFWQCNVALGFVAQQLARTHGMPVSEVRADLIDGLNPGVRLMPSHVMALALAQERGFTYMKP